jgi:predicted RNA-binding Zn ribbon-like protein
MPQATTFDSFGWQGRDRCLALADTVVVVRGAETIDLLVTEADLRRWLEAHEPWLGPVAPRDAPALPTVHRLRAAIRDLLFAASRGESLSRDAAAVLNEYAAASPSYRRLEVSGTRRPRAVRVSAGDRPSQVLAVVADAAIDLISGPDLERLRICPAPSCGMFFLEGRSGQQWCSTSCGNRARVARHYDRTKRAAKA